MKQIYLRRLLFINLLLVGVFTCVSCITSFDFAPPANKETSNCAGKNCEGTLCEPGCTAENGKTCKGSKCVTLCGNGKIDRLTEECDDGNVVSRDGCSSECKLEVGYNCIIPNQACFKTCKKILDISECLDGNNENFDGCSHDCKVEPGWVYDNIGFRRRRGWVCGGSSNGCELPTCGDGIVAEGYEECDDGNMIKGDGCSDRCKIEKGWLCPDLYTKNQDKFQVLIIPVTYRMFDSLNILPQCTVNADYSSLIKSNLTNNNRMALIKTLPSSCTLNNSEKFADIFYGNLNNSKKVLRSTLKLTRNSKNNGETFYYKNATIDPFENRVGYNGECINESKLFSTVITLNFQYLGNDQVFKLDGDDDTWGFINRIMFANRAGEHALTTPEVVVIEDTLQDKKAPKKNKKYEIAHGDIYQLKIFSTNREQVAGLELEIPSDGFVGPSVCTRCGDGVVSSDEQCDDGNQNNDDLCDNQCGLHGSSCALDMKNKMVCNVHCPSN